MKIKLLSVLLTTALLLSATACTGKENSSADSTSQSTSTTTSSSTEATENTTATTTSSTTDTTATQEPESSVPDEAEVWDPAVIQRQIMFDEGYTCGVILLGYIDGAATADDCKNIFLDSVYAEEFEFITDIPDENCVITENGTELYLIIPCNTDDVQVTVREWQLTEDNDYMGGAGDVLYSSEYGAPVLIKCNVSDIMPNTVVIIEDNGDTLQWSPHISLKDGSVGRSGVEEMVYDFTHYLYNESYEAYTIE